MIYSVLNLQRGESGIIQDLAFDEIPLPLIEMGCIPGKEVTLVQVSPMKDPLYIRVNDSHFAIRQATAACILLEKITIHANE
ncbi:MAG: FeoA family protein [Flavicella sp.]